MKAAQMILSPDMDAFTRVNEAIERGITKYTFLPGVYRVDCGRENIFTFRGLDGIEIDGYGAVLFFNGIVRPFVFERCNSINIRGIGIDWETPPYTHAVILSGDGTRFTVELLDQTDKPLRAFEAFTEFDPETKAPRRNGNDVYWDLDAIRHIEGGRYEITFQHRHQPSPEGTIAVMRHVLYDYDGFTFRSCSNVSFEQVTIHCAAGMAVCGYDSDDFKFSKVRVSPPPGSGRLMSTVADGLHFMNCAGNMTVEDSVFEYTGDDAFNSHGMLLAVQGKEGNLISAAHPRGYHLLPHIGDTVEITEPKTLLAKGKAVVKSAVLQDDGVKLELENADCNIRIGDYLANASRNVKLVFRNNIVRNKRCRGLLIQTRDALVEGNRFENNSGGGVLIYSEDFAFWESIGARDVVVRNNYFKGNNFSLGRCEGDIGAVCYTEGYRLGGTGVHKNILIKGNKIEDTGNSGIYIGCAEDAAIIGNTVSSAADPTSRERNSGIQLQKSKNIRLENNRISDNGMDGFCPVFAWPDVVGLDD